MNSLFFNGFKVIWMVCVTVTMVRPGIVASDYKVQLPQPVLLSATVSPERGQVLLQWEPLPPKNSVEIRVYRKPLAADTWGEPLVVLPGETVSYRDSGVSAGSLVEYRVSRKTSRQVTEHGFISVAVDAPLIEDRGTIILVVDESVASNLEPELGRLQQDLAGDGWTVDTIRFPRGLPAHNPGRRFDRSWRGRGAYADQVRSLKDAIRVRYLRDPERVRAVFLLGHLPVPYAGDWAPDGHVGGGRRGNHNGAQPMDIYYGDMDGEWTDERNFPLVSDDFRNFNIAGDGKFDKGYLFRNPVELMVGRVDLSDLPAFRENEVSLLKRYLEKNHRYRHGIVSYPRRALVENRIRAQPSKDSWFRSFWTMFGAGGVHTFGHVKYDVAIPGQGSYFMWCRVKRSDRATAFWISEEGKPEQALEIAAIGTADRWEWIPVSEPNSERPRVFRLKAGKAGIYFRPRRIGATWDQIVLTTDSRFTPPNAGPIADLEDRSPGSQRVVFEAESGVWTLPILVVSDPSAGGDHLLTVTTPVHEDVRFFSTLRDTPYLWGCAFSTGHRKGLNSVGDIDDFVSSPVRSAFNLLYGSWFGDWDAPDNFLRGALGGSDTLASCWLGPAMMSNRSVTFHRLATGATIGSAVLLTQYDPGKTFSDLPAPPPNDAVTVQSHVSLMGDPTLRMDVTPPPVDPRMVRRGFGRVDLSWNAPSAASVDGYAVYAGEDIRGPFKRMSGDRLVRDTRFVATDSGPVFQVRSVSSVTNSSGAYWNASQGLFFGP